MLKNRLFTSTGAGLLELLIVMALIILLIFTALPRYSNWHLQNKVKQQANQLVLLLRHAQMLAVTQASPVFVQFSMAGHGCAIVSYLPDCSCIRDTACAVYSSRERGVFSANSSLMFSSYGAAKALVFQPLHALSMGHAGTLLIGHGAVQIKVIINNLGRIRLCAPAEHINGIASC